MDEVKPTLTEGVLAEPGDPMRAVHGLRRIFHRHIWVRQRPRGEFGWTEDCLRCGKTRERHYFMVMQ